MNLAQTSLAQSPEWFTLPNRKRKIRVREHPRYKLLPEEQYDYYRQQGEIVSKYVTRRRNNNGRLEHKLRKEAVKELGVSISQVQDLLDEWEMYEHCFPDRSPVDSLVPIPAGRPKEKKLTDDQEHVAIFLYLYPERTFIYEDNTIATVRYKATFELVYNTLKEIWPDLDISLGYLRNFINGKKKDKQAMFDYARKGEAYFFAKYVLKIEFDFEKPDAFWLFDERVLPILVNAHGEICTVSFIGFQDGYTGMGLGQRVIARKFTDENGKVHKVSCTAADAKALFANTVRHRGRCCRTVYADNATVNKALADALPEFTEPGSGEIDSTFSQPGRPQGRGKNERYQALINAVCKRQPGYIEDEDDDYCWRHAYSYYKNRPHELKTIKQLQMEVDGFVNKTLNQKKFQDNLTKEKAWETLPNAAITAPDPIVYARVATAKVWTKAPVHHEGILYRRIHYHPVAPGGYERIKNNIDRKVPFCIIDLGDEDLVLACLDGKSFEEVIDRRKKRDSTSEHVYSQKSVDKNQRRELDENYQIMLEIVRNQYRPGQLPFVQSATGETRPPVPPQLPEESGETKKAETGAEPKKTGRNKGQTKTKPLSSAQAEQSAQSGSTPPIQDQQSRQHESTIDDRTTIEPQASSGDDETDPFLDQLDQLWD